ncbi:unnamed protein product, partial [Linum tenue]
MNNHLKQLSVPNMIQAAHLKCKKNSLNVLKPYSTNVKRSLLPSFYLYLPLSAKAEADTSRITSLQVFSYTQLSQAFQFSVFPLQRNRRKRGEIRSLNRDPVYHYVSIIMQQVYTTTPIKARWPLLIHHFTSNQIENPEKETRSLRRER